MIRLTLTSSGRQHDLSLPAAEEQLEQAKRALDVEDFSQAGITAVKFSSPHLASLLPLDAAAAGNGPADDVGSPGLMRKSVVCMLAANR